MRSADNVLQQSIFRIFGLIVVGGIILLLISFVFQIPTNWGMDLFGSDNPIEQQVSGVRVKKSGKPLRVNESPRAQKNLPVELESPPIKIRRYMVVLHTVSNTYQRDRKLDDIDLRFGNAVYLRNSGYEIYVGVGNFMDFERAEDFRNIHRFFRSKIIPYDKVVRYE